MKRLFFYFYIFISSITFSTISHIVCAEQNEQTLYDVLGVTPDASITEIRKAFFIRIKSSHPDKNSQENAHDITAELTEAFRILSDETSRASYDQELYGTTYQQICHFIFSCFYRLP